VRKAEMYSLTTLKAINVINIAGQNQDASRPSSSSGDSRRKSDPRLFPLLVVAGKPWLYGYLSSLQIQHLQVSLCFVFTWPSKKKKVKNWLIQ
jgi:hypothetical protein